MIPLGVSKLTNASPNVNSTKLTRTPSKTNSNSQTKLSMKSPANSTSNLAVMTSFQFDNDENTFYDGATYNSTSKSRRRATVSPGQLAMLASMLDSSGSSTPSEPSSSKRNDVGESDLPELQLVNEAAAVVSSETKENDILSGFMDDSDVAYGVSRPSVLYSERRKSLLSPGTAALFGDDLVASPAPEEKLPESNEDATTNAPQYSEPVQETAPELEDIALNAPDLLNESIIREENRKISSSAPFESSHSLLDTSINRSILRHPAHRNKTPARSCMSGRTNRTGGKRRAVIFGSPEAAEYEQDAIVRESIVAMDKSEAKALFKLGEEPEIPFPSLDSAASNSIMLNENFFDNSINNTMLKDKPSTSMNVGSDASFNIGTGLAGSLFAPSNGVLHSMSGIEVDLSVNSSKMDINELSMPVLSEKEKETEENSLLLEQWELAASELESSAVFNKRARQAARKRASASYSQSYNNDLNDMDDDDSDSEKTAKATAKARRRSSIAHRMIDEAGNDSMDEITNFSAETEKHNNGKNESLDVLGGSRLSVSNLELDGETETDVEPRVPPPPTPIRRSSRLSKSAERSNNGSNARKPVYLPEPTESMIQIVDSGKKFVLSQVEPSMKYINAPVDNLSSKLTSNHNAKSRILTDSMIADASDSVLAHSSTDFLNSLATNNELYEDSLMDENALRIDPNLILKNNQTRMSHPNNQVKLGEILRREELDVSAIDANEDSPNTVPTVSHSNKDTESELPLLAMGPDANLDDSLLTDAPSAVPFPSASAGLSLASLDQSHIEDLAEYSLNVQPAVASDRLNESSLISETDEPIPFPTAPHDSLHEDISVSNNPPPLPSNALGDSLLLPFDMDQSMGTVTGANMSFPSAPNLGDSIIFGTEKQALNVSAMNNTTELPGSMSALLSTESLQSPVTLSKEVRLRNLENLTNSLNSARTQQSSSSSDSVHTWTSSNLRGIESALRNVQQASLSAFSNVKALTEASNLRAGTLAAAVATVSGLGLSIYKDNEEEEEEEEVEASSTKSSSTSSSTNSTSSAPATSSSASISSSGASILSSSMSSPQRSISKSKRSLLSPYTPDSVQKSSKKARVSVTDNMTESNSASDEESTETSSTSSSESNANSSAVVEKEKVTLPVIFQPQVLLSLSSALLFALPSASVPGTGFSMLNKIYPVASASVTEENPYTTEFEVFLILPLESVSHNFTSFSHPDHFSTVVAKLHLSAPSADTVSTKLNALFMAKPGMDLGNNMRIPPISSFGTNVSIKSSEGGIRELFEELCLLHTQRFYAQNKDINAPLQTVMSQLGRLAQSLAVVKQDCSLLRGLRSTRSARLKTTQSGPKEEGGFLPRALDIDLLLPTLSSRIRVSFHVDLNPDLNTSKTHALTLTPAGMLWISGDKAHSQDTLSHLRRSLAAERARVGFVGVAAAIGTVDNFLSSMI